MSRVLSGRSPQPLHKAQGKSQAHSAIEDPELLPYVNGSEIGAAVDVSICGLDGKSRPVFINQEQDCLHLTLDDAARLHAFLGEAIKFLSERRNRSCHSAYNLLTSCQGGGSLLGICSNWNLLL